MDLQLKGKKAFISGSTQGIGYAIAQQLAQEGASVVINGRTKEKTQKITNQLKKQYPNAQISGIAADFSNKEEVYSLLDQLDNIDILINNLGIFDMIEFENITDEQWYHYYPGRAGRRGSLLSAHCHNLDQKYCFSLAQIFLKITCGAFQFKIQHDVDMLLSRGRTAT